MKTLLIIFLGIVSFHSFAQNDTIVANQDAIFNRPFIVGSKYATAIGGYAEANTNYIVEDGLTEGFGMEMRRFNIFLFSKIHKRISLLSELEFEHGVSEIALETALIDIALTDDVSFRAGILLPMIGMVNANHDSPNWEFEGIVSY